MSWSSDIRSIKGVRKARRCNWCYGIISVGEPATRYVIKDGSDFDCVTMHPECFKAMSNDHQIKEEGFYDAGSFKRGSTEQRPMTIEEIKEVYCGEKE